MLHLAFKRLLFAANLHELLRGDSVGLLLALYVLKRAPVVLQVFLHLLACELCYGDQILL